MKLYYSETLMPRKVCALARHLRSPVEFVNVNLGAGEHQSPAFAAMNPNRKAPVLAHDGGTIWASNAIMCFLARQPASDLFPAADRLVEMPRWLCWDPQHFTRYAEALSFPPVIQPHFGSGTPHPVRV